jgi:hypothetical protein
LIRALVQPVALVGLLLGFAAAVVVRAVVQHMVANRGPFARRQPAFEPRRDIDVFGVVAAVLGGTGWGRRAGDRPSTAVLFAGPGAVLLASQLAFAAYWLLGGDSLLPRLYVASDVFRGVPSGESWERILYSFAMSLLCFGLLALVPLPPLDGWGLLASRMGPRPGPGFAKTQHWLDEQNIGVVILLVGLIIPLTGGLPLFLFLLDLATYPVRVIWA